MPSCCVSFYCPGVVVGGDLVVKEPQRPVFGKQAWEKYVHDVGPEPPLPPNIDQILDSACPFWSGRKVHDTHLLTLIPARVDRQAFSLNLLGSLIKQQFPSNEKGFFSYTDPVKTQFGNKSISKSYWVLMTREVIPHKELIPHKKNLTYEDKKALVARYKGYELPSALEATTSILGHYFLCGERLFGDKSNYRFTYCSERTEWNNPVCIGGFTPDGLCILDDEFYNYTTGVACSRRL